MELSFIFYLFAAFIIIPGTYFILSSQRKFIAAIIACIGLLVLFVLFGIQIYTVEGKYATSPTNTMTWPPSINMCPDFLSLYKVNGMYYCVDTAGVSKKPDQLEKFNPTTAAGSTSATDKHLFNIFPLEADDDKRRTNIKKECIDKGVTWEGVYDGINGYNNTIPKPT
jgi:hypothetical protein